MKGIGMNKFMRIIVFFDLPVKSKRQRLQATRFRNFLIKDGFFMLQYSIYARVCNGQDATNMHIQRIKGKIPEEGGIRCLTVTEKQYENIDILLGPTSKYEKKQEYETISFF